MENGQKQRRATCVLATSSSSQSASMMAVKWNTQR